MRHPERLVNPGQQIAINAIRCGDAADTAQAWQQIAMLGKGEFSTIEQNGGVQQVATPYDEKMAKLSAEDHAAIDAGLRAEAVQILAQLEALDADGEGEEQPGPPRDAHRSGSP